MKRTMPVCLTLGFFLVATLSSLSAVELAHDGKPVPSIRVCQQRPFVR